MHFISTIARREFSSYFSTPLALIFLVIFLVLSGVFTFYLGGFFERGQADLQAFFSWHPWLYLVLVPAISMRLWAEERNQGTIELLMTLPVSTFELVVGKFVAAWGFLALALVLTVPIWWTVNYLGEPDNGVIVASYLGSWLMAGGFLAIGSCVSASTKNQVIAFILSLMLSLLLVLSGFPLVLDFFSAWSPQWLIDAIASLSFLTHFQSIAKGVIDLRDLLYFVVLIAVWLLATSVVIDLKKAD